MILEKYLPYVPNINDKYTTKLGTKFEPRVLPNRPMHIQASINGVIVGGFYSFEREYNSVEMLPICSITIPKYTQFFYEECLEFLLWKEVDKILTRQKENKPVIDAFESIMK